MRTILTDRAVQRFVDKTSRLRRDARVGYSLALISFLVALILRFLLDPYLAAGFPFLTFFPAIVLTAFIGGFGPGVVTSILSVLSAWYWFVEPRNSFSLDLQSAVAVAFFVVIAAVDVVIIDLMTRALDRLATAQAETRTLLEERSILFNELQHRVANNMAMVAGVLLAQQHRLGHNHEAVMALQAARERFELLARIHRQLYDPANARLGLASLLPTMCTDAVRSRAGDGVELVVRCEDLHLDMDRATKVCLLALELVTNALKHGLSGRADGRIEVELGIADGEIVLRVSDDGGGFVQSTFDQVEDSESRGLGTRILTGLAKSLGGKLLYHRPAAGGTAAEATFPLAR